MSGLCGVVSKANCSENLLFGTDYHSHLGSDLAGMAVYGGSFQKKIRDISQGQFKSKFGDVFDNMKGQMGIGVISDKDAQPLLIRSKHGAYAIAYAGLVENKNELTEKLFERGAVFTETTGSGINAVELLAKIIEIGDDIVDGITGVFDMIQGSASMLVLTPEGLIAARDRLGRTPLALGEKEGSYMVASENGAFMNLGHKMVKQLAPGEVILIKPDGYKVIVPPKEEMQICAFLWVYTGYPASSYEEISVERVRERCGAALAKRDDIEADLASGVPDSGIGHAIGYAMESGLPYRRALVKYSAGYGRSYIPPSQKIRDHVAKMKLLAVPEVIKGNRLVICEDSIVRGTQLRSFTMDKLWQAGAKEVHVRPACPPLMYPCRFALSTRKQEELVTWQAIRSINGDSPVDIAPYLDETTREYRQMIDWINNHIGATTLRYQTLGDMIEAIGMPKERLCTYCWNGQSQSYTYNPKQKELGFK